MHALIDVGMIRFKLTYNCVYLFMKVVNAAHSIFEKEINSKVLKISACVAKG